MFRAAHSRMLPKCGFRLLSIYTFIYTHADKNHNFVTVRDTFSKYFQVKAKRVCSAYIKFHNPPNVYKELIGGI